MEKTYYVYILLKTSDGFFMFIVRFFSSSANFLVTKALSKCKNEVYSTLIRNSLIFFIYN